MIKLKSKVPANKHSPKLSLIHKLYYLSMRPALPPRNRWVPLPWYVDDTYFDIQASNNITFFSVYRNHTHITHTYCVLTHTAQWTNTNRWFYIVHSLYGNINNILASRVKLWLLLLSSLYCIWLRWRGDVGDWSFYSDCLWAATLK